MLLYNPLTDIPKETQHFAIGGEVSLCTESPDSTTLDFMFWPSGDSSGNGDDVHGKGAGEEVGENRTRRLAMMRERLVQGEVRAGMVQMEWGLIDKT